MNKNLVMRTALVAMALAVLASIPFDFLCAQFSWSYPDFDVRTTDVFVSDLHLWPHLVGLRYGLVHAALFSVAAAVGLIACWGHEEREEKVVAWLALAACLYAAFSRQPAVAEDVDTLVQEARLTIVAAYPLFCLVSARLFHRHLPGPTALVLGVACHLAAVMLCAWDGTGYALAVNVPTVVWMALCWTLYCAPVHFGRLRTYGTGRRVALASLSVLAQTLVLSWGRISEIVGSLALPARPQPGYFQFNWATTHLDALAALPGSQYRDLVADPSLLEGLQRIPLAWLGVTSGPSMRLAYAALLVLFLACVIVVWRNARADGHDMVASLALAVLLSNLWGAMASILSFTSTGVVTLASGNPFQLVPIACLEAAGMMSGRTGRHALEFSLPWHRGGTPLEDGSRLR